MGTSIVGESDADMAISPARGSPGSTARAVHPVFWRFMSRNALTSLMAHRGTSNRRVIDTEGRKTFEFCHRFPVFDALSQPEATFRQNVWQFGM